MFPTHSNDGGDPSQRVAAQHVIRSHYPPGMLLVWLMLIGVIPTVANAAAPTAVDVYAATQKNTSGSPQSALVVLEGADIDFDTLTYSILTGPGNGSLSDPGNSGAAVATGEITGQSLTYIPNEDFTGTDTITYRVDDGADDSPVQTATITVFAAYREIQRQLGGDIDGEVADDKSGASIALSSDGQTVAIGASSNGGTDTDAGHVRVYRFDGSAWAQRGADIDGEAADDLSGSSMALSSDGQTLAIGAPDNGNSRAGHVRVYRYSGNAWTQLGADIDGEASGDFAGTSVALSSDGEIVAIGAVNNNGPGSNTGHVRVYHYIGSTWTQQGADINGEEPSDKSGYSVALSSDGLTVAIGARENDGTDNSAGHVRVYQFDGSTWTQRGADIDGEAASDLSGTSVALSSDGQTVAIGAPFNDGTANDAGHVRVYQFDGITLSWTQQGADIDGLVGNDNSGTSVALSSDGQTVAIGAPSNDGNGGNAGHVRVYLYNGSVWIQRGADIDGEAAVDNSGSSVALSSDGQTVAIGAPAPFNSANAGHVRVYDLTNQASVFSGDTVGIGSEDGAVITGTVAVTDPDSLAISEPYSVTMDPANGVANVAGDGSWTYTPNADFNGVDSFTITVTDSLGVATPQVITVTVTAQNDAPTAVDVYAATQKNTSGSPQSALVVLDGADIDFGALNYSIVSGPGNGNLSDPENSDAAVTTGDIAGQSVTYTPSEDFTGTDTITYRVNDGDLDSATQTATITVFDAYRESQRQLGADIDGEAEDDISGTSVALSSDGQTVAIGAKFNDGSAVDAGHVRVYRYNGSIWTQLGADIDGEADRDFLGSSVALSSDGQTVAIGAVESDSRKGNVRVYRYSGSAWIQRGADIDGEAGGDRSGYSVALSSNGQTVAIGALDNDGSTFRPGHVRIYHFMGSAWVQLGADIDGEAGGDRSGSSMALSSDGQTVAIGAPSNDGNSGNAGHVRVYLYNGSVWIQRGADIDGEAAGDDSGSSVALSSDGQTVAIGALFNNDTASNAGHVRVYRYVDSAWAQLGTDIDGEAASDLSGTSVALSSDGHTVAIGATGNDDGPGNRAGHVRVYQFDGSTWTQRGADIDGEAASDLSGTSVALSSDGQTVAIGAPFSNGTATNAGHVRVYDRTNRPSVFGGDTAGIGSENGEAITGTLAAADPDGLAGSDPYNMTVDPANGVANVAADGGWSYAPFADFNGMDSFTITGTDLLGVATPQVITVTVLAEDTDEDGIADDFDICDTTPAAESSQVNSVGCGPSERDTDSDDTNDDQDAFPNDPNEQVDSDGDGYGDNEEAEAGTDPNDPNDQPVSPGLPIWLLYEATQ